MNIYYNNKFYFFSDNDFEKNIIFIKLKEKFNFDNHKINSITNFYISKKRYNCNYDDSTEKMMYTYINEIL